LVEFFDYNCGFCRQAHADLVKLVEEDERLRVVLKEYPVLGPGSVEAAQVGIAVNIVAAERYREFHDRMLALQGQASGERALAEAEAMGLDGAAIRAAMQDPRIAATIEEVYMLADALGITGTPTYVVGDEVVVGAVGFERLSEKIQAVRNCGSTVC
jgi:protein-disulfide isomerase